MVASQSLLVVVTVDADVKLVLGSELSHHLFDVGHSLFAASHGLGGEVGVTSRTIPVWEQFWSE